VLVGQLRQPGSDTALFVNCSNARIAPNPILADGISLSLDGQPLILDPFGIAAVPCRNADSQGRTDAAPERIPVAAARRGRDAQV
jgi:hypothetical protein